MVASVLPGNLERVLPTYRLSAFWRIALHTATVHRRSKLKLFRDALYKRFSGVLAERAIDRTHARPQACAIRYR